MQALLGTFVDVRASATAESVARSAVDAAINAVGRVQSSMSFHDPMSELSRVHRYAWRRAVRISAPLYRVLHVARMLAQASQGAFDVTVAGRLIAAGRLPLPRGVPDPDLTSCWRHVELLPQSKVRLIVPLLMDLGGIAKGYALDCAIRAMRRAGAVEGSINAGGDLRVLSPRGSSVFVRHPTRTDAMYLIAKVRQGAVATSAPYLDEETPRAGIVDPMVAPLRTIPMSVTVIARRGIWADALTKVVALRPDACGKMLAQLSAEALTINADGEARIIRTSASEAKQWHWCEGATA